MNYYDLLKQYVSTGKSLEEHQFNIITKDGSLLGSYLYNRGKIICPSNGLLSRIEYEYLIKNPKLFIKLGKDALVCLIKNGERWRSDWNDILKNVSNVIFGHYYDSLTSDDIDVLVRGIYDPELFGRVYRDKPELFKSFFSRFRLYIMGVIGNSEFEVMQPIIIPVRDFNGLFKENIENWLYNFRYGYGFDLDWEVALKNYVNYGNIKLMAKILGLRDGVKYKSSTIQRNIEKHDRVDIVEEIDESVNDVYLDDVLRVMGEALSYYGDVLEINKDYVNIKMDLSKLKIDWSAHEGVPNSAIINYLQGLPNSNKPSFVIPKVEDLDWGLFNEYLSDRLKMYEEVD